MGKKEIYPDVPVCPDCGYNGRMYFHGGFVVCPDCGGGPKYDPEIHGKYYEGAEVFLLRNRVKS